MTIKSAALVMLGLMVCDGCSAAATSCGAPRHWIGKEGHADLRSRDVIAVDSSLTISFDGRRVSHDKLLSLLRHTQFFDVSPFLDVRISSKVRCENASVIVREIDNAAKCRDHAACKLTRT